MKNNLKRDNEKPPYMQVDSATNQGPEPVKLQLKNLSIN